MMKAIGDLFTLWAMKDGEVALVQGSVTEQGQNGATANFGDLGYMSPIREKDMLPAVTGHGLGLIIQGGINSDT